MGGMNQREEEEFLLALWSPEGTQSHQGTQEGARASAEAKQGL